ncbi:mercuric transport protein MerTP [Galbibacter sp. EGI 63066]|uniref:mercuric transport protein MerTP n=1 Tax=Galbibacter sp. EGI 63066 TaxID=2993559 RepID=UPI0022492658|nr:mercuric transport protein MerTP [Galbibacter sp. EGI 63066]MCX2679875.1 mercuric transport protein MerTP [Galbibacter sp. EGI 63066]
MKKRLLLGSSILTAVGASLCCIVPVLALIAGVGGFASAFSWVEPIRPYLVGMTILVLGFAWYHKLKPKKEVDCNCETDSKTGRSKFIQSKTFLGIVTVFASLMLAFPMYAHVFYPKVEKQVVIVDKSDVQKVEFSISGMTCNGCAAHVDHEVNKLPGIINITTSYKNKNSIIEFDSSKTDVEEIKEAINATGYTVTDKKEQ